jgi:hypothetical protein
MRKQFAITVILVTSLYAGSLWAQAAGCRYNGQLYPVGTKLGNVTCMANGTWK